MAVVESYVKTDIQDQNWLLELHFVRDKWEVWCWQVEFNGDSREAPWKAIEHLWDVHGVVTGYVDGNLNREIREPFTEETARAEFEKWRQ
jgi:hypothetical protein